MNCVLPSKAALILLLIFGLAPVLAQDPPAEPAQDPKPAVSKIRKFGVYTVDADVETGYRFLGTDGSLSKYRSDLNYGRGPRLLNLDFLARSGGDDGLVFDTLQVNASGWGGDPAAFLRFDIEKKKWYRFAGSYRRVDYFNNLANFALNQHLSDTHRRLGDFTLTLLPGNENFRVNLGYSVNRDKGASLTTFYYNRDEFPISSPIRQLAQDFRVGVEARVFGVDINFLQGYRSYKDDTTFIIPSLEPGNNPTNLPSLSTFQRQIPSRGEIPFTQLSLHTLVKQRFDFTGRLTYTTARSRFRLFETKTGKDYDNNNIVLDQLIGGGQTKRPNAMGDFGVTVYLTDRISVSEVFRFNNFRIDGNQFLASELYRTRETFFGMTELPPLITEFLSIRSIGFRQLQNVVEVDFKINQRFTGHLGYRYSNRRLIQGGFDEGQSLAFDTETARNETHAFLAGFRAAPLSNWKVYFDIEHGEADNVFFRVANWDYTDFRIRSLYKPIRSLVINNSFIYKDNNNPTRAIEMITQNFGVDIQTRIFSNSVEWTPIGRFSVNGGYTRTNIDSDAAVVFFLNRERLLGRSLYLMRNNYFYLNTTTRILPRVDLFVGYRIQKDTGQGDRTPADRSELLSSYPLRFQSPEARLTVRLLENVSWIFGWQYYDYKEKFLDNQNYRANLGYVSLRLGF